MKKMLVASFLMLALCSSTFAGRIGWEPVPYGSSSEDSRTGSRGESDSGSSNSGYQGTSGARYQYNLNNAVDRVRYGADPAVQLRDRISVDPGRNVDRSTGQHGGGYLGR